ncbi:MAG TPA: hypothetical protein DEH11_20565, partial [Actinobacteria bacterium]|nr:hypothetical protein [Actinomycetota bacterium]
LIDGTGLIERRDWGSVGSDRWQPALLVRCRDDGAIARRLGALARGQLVPLPPALVGLAAGAALAVLGLSNLPAIVAIAPVAALLLAAFGSSHPHDGRFDWLVPAILQGAQYLYIAALGFALHVPAGVILLLCAVIMLWSADLASGPPRRRAAWLGWDGRMILLWLGYVAGVATFAY